MNALEKVVDLLTAVTILFLLPILYYGSEKQVSQAMLAGQAADYFLRCVSTAGEITMPVWHELEEMLDNMEGTRFEIKRERSLYAPTKVVGEIVEHSYVAESETLLEQLQKEGSVRLLAGDKLWLTIYVHDVPALYYAVVRTEGSEL